MSDPVRAEPDGDVLVVTIDRPEARNAVNVAVAEGIAAAVDRLDGDDSLRAGILTGRGRDVLRGDGPEGLRRVRREARAGGSGGTTAQVREAGIDRAACRVLTFRPYRETTEHSTARAARRCPTQRS